MSLEIRVSTHADKVSYRVLNGMVVTSPLYVFVASDPGITKVEFLLDGVLIKTELSAPWDLATVNAKAVPYDFTKLALGKHAMTARVYQGTALTTTIAAFTVGRSAYVKPSPVTGRGSVPAARASALNALSVTSPVVVGSVQDLSYVTARS